MERGRAICTVKVTQSIMSCYIYQKSNWMRRTCHWHNETLQTALIPVQKNVGYIRSTVGRMLLHMHDSSENTALTIVMPKFPLDDVNMPSCTYRSLPYLALTKQFRFRVQGNTMRNSFDLINSSHWVLFENGMSPNQSKEFQENGFRSFAFHKTTKYKFICN